MENFSPELIRAQTEAELMKEKIKSGSAENYGEAEVMVKIEKIKNELRDIGHVFNIDTDNFSDENDKQFAEDEMSKVELLKKYCEKKGLDFEKFGDKRMFIIDKKKRVGKFSTGIEFNTSFRGGYTLIQAKEIEKHGKIIDASHDNVSEDIREFEQLFLPNELECVKKLHDLRLEIKQNIQGLLIVNEIKIQAKTNEVIAKFVNYLESTNQQIGTSYDFNNHTQWIKDADKTNNWSDDEVAILRQKEEEISNATFEKVSELKTLHGRLLSQIAKVYYQRVAYLFEQAETGNDNLIINKENNNVEISPEFNFSENDLLKAVELNLPWSKYEKEIAEYSGG